MDNKIYSSVELFLNNSSQYLLLHESSPTNPNIEHYFISVTILDIKDNALKGFIDEYQKKYPLIGLSDKSNKYIKNKEGRYYFLFLDTLDKSDRFFTQKEDFLKKNISNILSIRMLGKAVDLSTYVDTQAEKYFSQFLDISQSVAQIMKKEVKSGMQSGLKILNDNAPIIKKKFNNIRNKIIK